MEWLLLIWTYLLEKRLLDTLEYLNTYSLVSQVVYQAMEKGMVALLNNNVGCGLAIEWFSVEFIWRTMRFFG